MSNVIFSMSEGIAEHLPDWESRQLYLFQKVAAILRFDPPAGRRLDRARPLRRGDLPAPPAATGCSKDSDAAIRLNETLTPGDGPPIGSRPTPGNDPLLALYRLLRPSLDGYQADPRDWTAEVMRMSTKRSNRRYNAPTATPMPAPAEPGC